MKTSLLYPAALIICLNIFCNIQLKAQAINVNDSLSLVDLYDSCNGSAWRINTNWLQGPVSTWYGVTVTGTRVTGLNLNYNYLTGSIPASFGNLDNLQTFTCDDNHLSGSIPSSFGNLINLTSLSMYDNQLTDSIPSSVGNLIHLTNLQLGYNQLSGSLPPSMGNMQAIQYMSITYCQLSGSIPSSFGNLTNMTTLYLNNNQLSGEVPSSFSNLTNLSLLLLLHNNLSQTTNSFPVFHAIAYLNFNSFTFNGLETVAQQMASSIYSYQATIDIHQQDNILSVSAGGQLQNNTYTWHLIGTPDSLTVITGDSTFHPTQSGQYFAEITNAIATQLTLTTDTVTYNAGNDSTGNQSKYYASQTGAININIAKDAKGNTYMIYRDISSGKAIVRKFNGTSWQTIGKANFSAGKINYPSIAVTNSGVPYVVYQDQSVNNKATVMMYNGNAWMPVGTSGISSGTASYTSITISKTGVPVIACQDGGAGNKAVVKSFNGSTWISVGATSFPVGIASYTCITTGPDGKIYLACNDKNTGSKARVVAFNGSTWQDVGNAGFSAGSSNFITLKFDKNKIPYVAFQDGNNGHGTMMKLQGNQWVAVNKRNAIGDSSVQYITFDFNSKNQPYVAFQDGYMQLYLTVETFNGNKWTAVGPKGFTPAQCEYSNMFFDKQGMPSVVFTDFSRNYDATLTQFSKGIWTDQNNNPGGFSNAITKIVLPDKQLKVFPDPAQSVVMISFYSATSNHKYQILITDVTGKLIQINNGIAAQGYNKINLEITAFPAGAYYIQLITSDDNQKVKFIKIN